MPGSARSRRREEERQRETGGEPNRALPQRQPRLRVRPQTRPRPQTHPSTPSKDGAGVAVLRCAARLGWGALGQRSRRGDSEKRRGVQGTRRQPVPALGRPLLVAPRPCPAGPCWVWCPRPRRSEAGRSAQRRPPAATRGLRPRAYPVQPALPGCAHHVRPGRGCGCGARGAVRRRGRQGGPVSGLRGSESRELDHPRLCPAGGELAGPRPVFQPPPRYREGTGAGSLGARRQSLQVPRGPGLFHRQGSKSFARPPPRPKSSSQ